MKIVVFTGLGGLVGYFLGLWVLLGYVAGVFIFFLLWPDK